MKSPFSFIKEIKSLAYLKSFFRINLVLTSPLKPKYFQFQLLKSSNILRTSPFVRLIQGRCATLSRPYLFLISDAIFNVLLLLSLPPAPYVTLIKSGLIPFNFSIVS